MHLINNYIHFNIEAENRPSASIIHLYFTKNIYKKEASHHEPIRNAKPHHSLIIFSSQNPTKSTHSALSHMLSAAPTLMLQHHQPQQQ